MNHFMRSSAAMSARDGRLTFRSQQPPGKANRADGYTRVALMSDSNLLSLIIGKAIFYARPVSMRERRKSIPISRIR